MHLLDLERAIACAPAEACDLALDLRQRLPIAVAHHRNHQSALRADGDRRIRELWHFACTGYLGNLAKSQEARVNELVGSDADIAAYVRQLEERDDDQIDESDLPSGDTLAAELERFLRDQRRD